MISFHGGPADGQKLQLKRAPRFLRVVESFRTDLLLPGKFDALDQLGDQAEPEEAIFAYEVRGDVGRLHLNYGGGKGGWYVIADYHFLPCQPTDSEMRSDAAWQAWCLQAAKAQPLSK
jgi:hypothetical protein